MLLTSTVDGRELEIRELRDDDVRPDESSEWDAWDDDWLPEEEQPVHQRAVVILDGEIVGTMSWHPVLYGPTRGSRAWSMGIGLAPHARGRGIGTVAQRLLSDHLLESAHRVEASTDIANLAEQRSLEKAGFEREGVLRGAQMRADGLRHDLVMYARVP
ncbi:MAG: GNAT family N-acetyltransferase [Candidatus Nanopelagicales bacterium]